MSLQFHRCIPLPPAGLEAWHTHTSPTVLQLSLRQFVTSSLRHPEESPLSGLQTLRRRTELRQCDLDAVLAKVCDQGGLRRYEPVSGRRYQLTIAGGVEVHQPPPPPWVALGALSRAQAWALRQEAQRAAGKACAGPRGP